MARHLATLSIAISATALMLAGPASAETVTIGIGTQDTTTNTVTAGTVIRQLHLLEKYLPTIEQIRQHQVRARLAELHLRSARHQCDDGEQASIRHDGRLSPHRERVHLREQSREQEPADRGRRLQPFGLWQRHRRSQGFALLRSRRSQGQAGQRTLRLRRTRHGAEGDAGPRSIPRTTSSSSARAPRSARRTCRRRRSTRMPTSCRSRSCCRSAASRARFSTASRPTCRPGMASWCAPTSRRNIRRSSSPMRRR